MIKERLILVSFYLYSTSLFALEQEDICRVEILRACQAKLNAEVFACNANRANGQEFLNCEMTDPNKCQIEAEQAACGGTIKPEETFFPKRHVEPQKALVTTVTSPRTNSTQLNVPIQNSPKQQPNPASAAAVTSAPQDPGSAQSEAAADIAQCNQLQSEATRCCGNPLACATPAQVQRANQIQQQVKNGPAPGQSIPNYCAQLGQLSSDSGSYNADMASACYGPQSSCSRTCQSLAQKYYSRASNCSESTCGIFQSAADQLSSLAGNCDMLAEQVSRWSSQSISTASSEAGSSLCSNNNFGTQSADKQNQKTNPLNFQAQSVLSSTNPCAITPNSQACAAAKAATASGGGDGGTSGYSSVAHEIGDSGFNPSSMQDMSDLNASLNIATDAGGVTTGSAHVVANNAGGGIPSSGNSGGAKMEPRKPTNPAASGIVADIMQGNRSGGGYSVDALRKNSNDNQFGSVGYKATSAAGKRGPASANGAGGGYLGMDLKRYLPSRVLQPHRGIAGLNESMEINGKSADLFKKISTKIEEKCRLGILWECR